ncbi:hypothetical protein MNBD_DELTA04-1756 [hydrothermal vent metagenome]|uniref:HTH cro/C1-type domain-containing protein n=1 Tax=hydrothermal vent metagenome TaxID=652676 RepID=A0A3B0VDL2_9ZZZZ
MSGIIKHLKYVRRKKRLTQAEFGAKLGLPQSHISRIEQGITDPRLSTVVEMAHLLDQELILVPRAMLPAVRAMISGTNVKKPRWQPDEDD